MCRVKRIINTILITAAACIAAAAITACNNSTIHITPVTEDMIRINEVMSSNSYFAALPDGTCCDWIELYNPSEESINVKGFGISDDTAKPRKWIVPDTRIIEPGEYLIVYMSGMDGVDEYGNLHTSFRLSAEGEMLLLSSSDGSLVQMLELPKCPIENISYGIDERTPEDGYVWMAEPSPGRQCSGDSSKNSGELVFASNGVLINEYMSNNSFTIYDRDSEYSDWIELYNPTDSDVSLAGCSLSDKGRDGSRWYFPDDTVIGPGEYLIVFCSGKLTEDSSELHTSFRLSEEDTSLVFFSASGTPMTSVDLIALPENVSCGIDSASGEWKLFSQATPGRENNTHAYASDASIKGAPAGGLIISEILAVSSSMEKDTLSFDYIELYNTSSEDISLSGYGLSEDAEGAVFRFPELRLEPGAYITVQCTGKDNTEGYQTGELTAAFKINQGGQTIYLFDPDGHVIDIFNSGKQTYGVTRGRLPDDLSKWHYFTKATPGAANQADAVSNGYTPAPVMSKDGGMVEKGFVLTMEYADGCTVRYTMDGSEPDSKSAVYDNTAGIGINETTVIKAAAFMDGYITSQTVTSTFFVDVEHSLGIVSLSSDPDGLFSAKNGIYSSKHGFVEDKPNYMSNEERACEVEYFVDGKLAVSFSAGTRIFGGGSRTIAQKSFSVMLREKYGANSVSYPFFEDNDVTTFSSLVLRQAGQESKYSKLRDELMATIVKNQVNCDYMDLVPVVLYVNGEYWGLYYIREKLNEDYLVNKYGYEKDNIDIVKYESEATAGTIDNYYAMLDFAEQNDLTISENYQAVCEMVNIDSLIDFWICETFCANNDTGNIRAYCQRSEDGKWAWMLFDTDNAFYPYLLGSDSIYNNLLDPKGHGMYNGYTNVLMRKLLENEDFVMKFVSRYCYHLKNTFAPERTTAMLDELAGLIESEIPAQYARWNWPSVNTWEGHISDIRDFLQKRPEKVIKSLKKNFDLSDSEFQAIYDAS